MPISAVRIADSARSDSNPAGRAVDRGRESEFARLARFGVPLPLLRTAEDHARLYGTSAGRELLALGFDRNLYFRMIAEDLGLSFMERLDGAALIQDAGRFTADAVRQANAILVRIDGKVRLVTAPSPAEALLLRRKLAESPALGGAVAIATPETIRGFIVARRHAALSHYALNRLARVMPRLSAGKQAPRGASGSVALLAAFIALTVVAPATSFTAFGVLSTLFFLNCGFWKLAAALRPLRRRRLEPVWDHELPTYGILVPLYREASVVPSLVAQLRAIDYPISKLQIILVVEADDNETREAAARSARGPQFEIVTVPPGGPRTKPKALTYALNFVRTDYVVVYDAEDRPDPEQLRKAVAAFRERPDLGCVQARLAPDNDDSWFARMFTVEYAANFEVMLPALAEWGAPLPLGGTSNHFPRAILERVAAWDPFNVTEDADLGIRLARFGYRSATILSRTYEEAPVTFGQWLPQRRRWIKGWMQTIAPCFGHGMPAGLRLSLWERLAVHGILSAGVLGLLLYPASLIVLVTAAVAAWNGAWPESVSARLFLLLNLANFSAVLTGAIVAAVRGLVAARRLRLLLHVPFLPVYWALMSLAAWQALFQYFRQPSTWEKTTHGVAKERRTPQA